MMLCNKTSRYHIASTAIREGAKHNASVAVDAHEQAMFMMHLARKDNAYIYEHGEGEFRFFFRQALAYDEH